ncbi:major facilitator superfamily permease [Corynebacterium resistens DSM 45100]|mgnify:CR=1 FL=1|uniref:Major facilitator superfamily permease n=1 Tax=Corynebacterium resistens (strain DSM 45100 / JCM 12819 / GTC 2026 / SICGH 158) TaxID=662755 RepID=F8E371_CORRG|nr:MFS transporter [Corynebacterium resistens]AEI10343.1 major facilitator superfamily permease [Corynebacterium resistens DSM 45100]
MSSPRSSARNYWKFIAFAVFAAAWGGNEFTPMMVFYRGERVFGDVFVDALLASYAAGIAISLLISGPLSDRYGRRTVMLPAPAVALVGSALIAAGETNSPLIFVGRVLSGISIGMAMTAGGSWIKELSTPSFDPSAKPGAGARRATMSLTAGFGLGALLAGCLAEWGPAPGQTPYLIHILLSVVSMAGLLTVPETRQSAHLNVKGSFWSDIATPVALHPRFLLAVLPIAPWVFGCAGVAYAILPSLTQDKVSIPIAFSAVITMVALTFGFGVQQISDTYLRHGGTRGQQLGLGLIIAGMLLAVWTAHERSLVGAAIAAIILGTAYGVCMITGLTEVQQLAGPDDLGGLTAIFYAVTYLGFFFPMILSKMSEWFTYELMLGVGVVIAVLSLVLVTIVGNRFRPEAEKTEA